MSSIVAAQKSPKVLADRKLHSLRASQVNAEGQGSKNAKRAAESRLTSKELKRPLYVIQEADSEELYDHETVQARENELKKPLDWKNPAFKADLEGKANSMAPPKKEKIDMVSETGTKSLNERDYIFKVS